MVFLFVSLCTVSQAIFVSSTTAYASMSFCATCAQSWIASASVLACCVKHNIFFSNDGKRRYQEPKDTGPRHHPRTAAQLFAP